MKPFDIFRTGTHRDSKGREFVASAAILAELADGYDPALSEAPLVVGHPEADGPAYGWVKSLSVDGDQLVAHPAQVESQFGDMVRDGRFKTRSVSFYGPTDASNPKPGTHYLKHVGFLGAQAPAVKGLRAVEFAGVEDAFEFTSTTASDGDLIVPTWFQRLIASVPPQAVATANFVAPKIEPTLKTKTAIDNGDTGMTEDELKVAQTALETDRAAFAEQAKTRRTADDAALVDAAVTAGRVTPARRDAVLAFAGSLDDDQSFTFSEAGKSATVTPRAFFADLLQSAAPAINFSEIAKDDQGDGDDDVRDPSVLAREARSFQADQAQKGISISMTEAVATVSKRSAQ